MLKRNNIFVGLFIGTIVPVLTYVLLKSLLATLDTTGWYNISLTDAFKERTLQALAIASNALIMRYYQQQRFMTESMRGLVLATFGWVIYWVIVYRNQLFT